MVHLAIMIALLAGLAFGQTPTRDINSLQPSTPVTTVAPGGGEGGPQNQAGGGEGGWPGF